MAAKPTADTPSAVPGEPLDTHESVLSAGASAIQSFAPLKSICAHLNAFHAYAHEPTRAIETNHYCAHLTKDVRQCILYDSDGPDARLIGIEYMITPALFEGLDTEEKALWHSHVFEVKSGMLIMPGPAAGRTALGTAVPGAQTAWEMAETEEMKHVIGLYGKVYHLWQTDRGDALPLGEPVLMTSFTEAAQFEDMQRRVGERDRRYGVDSERKAHLRRDIAVPQTSSEADAVWKRRKSL